MLNSLYLVFGIILLTIGGEALIRGALSAAKRFHVSPLLCGLVIVGFGTSAPELTVSVVAAIHQQPEIAIGNVVGSNIGNVFLILGLCAVINPLTIKSLALRRDVSTVVAASFLFLLLAQESIIGGIDGILLLTALLAYLIWAYWSERYLGTPSAELHQAEAEEVTYLPKSLVSIIPMVIIGLTLLIVGSKVLLTGAVGIAEYFEVPETVIGLTLVALGTSLPELSISVIATLRRHTDVAVGNILGSNIFNLLGILSISALLQPLSVPSRILQLDQWVMLASSLLLLLFLYTGRKLSRIEGAIFLTCYSVYIGLSFTIYGG